MKGTRSALLRSLTVLTIALLVAPLVVATPSGPTYPPPGGVTLSSSGQIGRAGGLTWSYADIDMDLFNGIWWGPWSPTSFQFAFDGAIDEASETLVFDFGSDLANGVAQWTGASDLRHFQGGAWVTENLPTRITLRASHPDTSALAFLDPTSVGIDGDLGAIVAVPGDYSVNAIIEAKRSNVWQPVHALYDGLQTDPACVGCVKLSIGAGFYTDLNAPPVAGFSWSPDPVVEREEATFTSSSSDPEGRPIGEAWDLDNDGAFDDASGPVAAATFATPGSYTIGLRVTDDRGLSTTLLQDVVVVDCSQGPVSGALRNTVYPMVKDVAEATAFYLACAVADETGL